MKSPKIKILLIGPFPNPITGNSVANKMVFEGLIKSNSYKVGIMNTSLSFFDEKVGVFSLKKMLHGIKFNLQFYKVLLYSIIYITPGQTFFGVLKYALIIILAKLFGKKIVVHIHGNHLRDSYVQSNKLKQRMMKLILKQSHAGIVLSKSLIPNLTPFLPNNRIHVVHNFVEDYLLDNTQTQIKNKKLESLRIIFLSNLMEEKGILDFFEALKILEDKDIEYEAKIAGHIDYSSKDQINQYINQLNCVKYCGVVRGEEKKNMLLWGNVFIFPTYYKMEGQPISIFEAMATGNIILTTNHAGIPDVFSIENGLYINKKNPKNIVDQIIKIIENKAYYNPMIYNNYLYAKNNFSSKLYISNLEKIFKSI